MASSLTNSLAAANDIRDIKPPVAIPNYWWVLWVGLGVLVVLGLLILFLRYLDRRNARISTPPPIPAHIRAKQKLQDALALIAQPKPFCIMVSDTVRTYLEERFTFRAPERTTEEFLCELQGTDLLAGEQKEKLGEFLESCDLVKFAKYEPGEPELRELCGAAIRLVDETTPPLESAKESLDEFQEVPKANAPLATIPALQKGKIFAIIGTLFQLGPLSVFLIGILTIFRQWKLSKSLSSVDSTHAIAGLNNYLEQIQAIAKDAILLYGLGYLFGVVGIILIGLALTSFRYRAEWFFWFLIIYSVVLLGLIPFIGTATGIFFLVYCLSKRREFLNKS